MLPSSFEIWSTCETRWIRKKKKQKNHDNENTRKGGKKKRWNVITREFGPTQISVSPPPPTSPPPKKKKWKSETCFSPLKRPSEKLSVINDNKREVSKKRVFKQTHTPTSVHGAFLLNSCNGRKKKKQLNKPTHPVASKTDLMKTNAKEFAQTNYLISDKKKRKEKSRLNFSWGEKSSLWTMSTGNPSTGEKKKPLFFPQFLKPMEDTKIHETHTQGQQQRKYCFRTAYFTNTRFDVLPPPPLFLRRSDVYERLISVRHDAPGSSTA